MKSELDKLTPESYKEWLNEGVERGEISAEMLDMFHVKFRMKGFDHETGKHEHDWEMQYVSKSAWGTKPTEGFLDYLRRGDYEYVVLYDPREKKVKIESAEAIDPDAEAKPMKGRKAKGE